MLSLVEVSLLMVSAPEPVLAVLFLAIAFFLAFFLAFLVSAVPVDFMLSVVALALASVLASVLAAGAAGVVAGAGVGVWAAAVNATAKAPASSADINLVIFPSLIWLGKSDTFLVSGALTPPCSLRLTKSSRELTWLPSQRGASKRTVAPRLASTLRRFTRGSP